jgi:hypothetical protein
LKRLLYALLLACGFLGLLLAILRLPSDSGIASSLKWASANLLLPGTYFGFLAAGNRIDDISFFVADSINFLLYSVLIYILLAAWERHRTRLQKSSGT